EEQLRNAQQEVSYSDPMERGVEYRRSAEKHFFDSTTTGFAQTFLNVPVWEAGVSITVKGNPPRVVSATNTSRDGIDARLPSPAAIERHRKLAAVAAVERTARSVGLADESAASQTTGFVRKLVDRTRLAAGDAAPAGDDARLIRGRFFVYQYQAAKRVVEP